jgi:hypothetical protein
MQQLLIVWRTRVYEIMSGCGIEAFLNYSSTTLRQAQGDNER